MTSVNEGTEAQLLMPGMPARGRQGVIAGRLELNPGVEVEYIGKVDGGPRFGASGVVKEMKAWRAVVDMGVSGTWLVPYYFLWVSRSVA